MMTKKVETPHFPSKSVPDTPRLSHPLPALPADPSYRHGTARHAHTFLGAHEGEGTVVFQVWAPQAIQVSVQGIADDWSSGVPMICTDLPGVWQATLPSDGVPDGTLYKYRILPQEGNAILTPDPYGRAMEAPPNDATVFRRTAAFPWRDDGWMHRRATVARSGKPQPLNIYEVRLGAWKPHRDDVPLSYHELADELTPYVKQMGYTHVLLAPLTEPTAAGLFAPSARYGSPDDLRTLVDILHGAGVGVLTAWSPTVTDLTHGEVRSYLLSNLHYWIEEFHLDGLRILPPDGADAAAWCALTLPLEDEHPDIILITPPSPATDAARAAGARCPLPCHTAWTKATLDYAREDPLFRKHKHDALMAQSRVAQDAFGVLPIDSLSVGHPYRSFLDCMPGDYWQKFAGARLFAAWVMTHPGGKLWHMGCEIGAFSSKDPGKPMEWYLLDFDAHARLQHYFAALHRLYLSLPPLWDVDTAHPDNAMIPLESDAEAGILAYRRVAADGREVIAVLNFTPVVHEQHPLPVPTAGRYREIFNSDNSAYGGSDVVNSRPLTAVPDGTTGRPTLTLRVPPLGCSLWVIDDAPTDA